eukprot:gnl/Chilomastix_cuspidata/2669.p1 GENE.gnl/Chilomastix_cuspidata/2669~~gnl/Chilomastix_cuspidata/2669.p1  ORF type:complete len:1052 (-),score=421.26 gnl/Chilomastix_cuspidata/2669:949-4104(-)
MPDQAPVQGTGDAAAHPDASKDKQERCLNDVFGTFSSIVSPPVLVPSFKRKEGPSMAPHMLLNRTSSTNITWQHKLLDLLLDIILDRCAVAKITIVKSATHGEYDLPVVLNQKNLTKQNKFTVFVRANQPRFIPNVQINKLFAAFKKLAARVRDHRNRISHASYKNFEAKKTGWGHRSATFFQLYHLATQLLLAAHIHENYRHRLEEMKRSFSQSVFKRSKLRARLSDAPLTSFGMLEDAIRWDAGRNAYLSAMLRALADTLDAPRPPPGLGAAQRYNAATFTALQFESQTTFPVPFLKGAQPSAACAWAFGSEEQMRVSLYSVFWYVQKNPNEVEEVMSALCGAAPRGVLSAVLSAPPPAGKASTLGLVTNPRVYNAAMMALWRASGVDINPMYLECTYKWQCVCEFKTGKECPFYSCPVKTDDDFFKSRKILAAQYTWSPQQAASFNLFGQPPSDYAQPLICPACRRPLTEEHHAGAGASGCALPLYEKICAVVTRRDKEAENQLMQEFLNRRKGATDDGTGALMEIVYTLSYLVHPARRHVTRKTWGAHLGFLRNVALSLAGLWQSTAEAGGNPPKIVLEKSAYPRFDKAFAVACFRRYMLNIAFGGHLKENLGYVRKKLDCANTDPDKAGYLRQAFLQYYSPSLLRDFPNEWFPTEVVEKIAYCFYYAAFTGDGPREGSRLSELAQDAAESAHVRCCVLAPLAEGIRKWAQRRFAEMQEGAERSFDKPFERLLRYISACGRELEEHSISEKSFSAFAGAWDLPWVRALLGGELEELNEVRVSTHAPALECLPEGRVPGCIASLSACGILCVRRFCKGGAANELHLMNLLSGSHAVLPVPHLAWACVCDGELFLGCRCAKEISHAPVAAAFAGLELYRFAQFDAPFPVVSAAADRAADGYVVLLAKGGVRLARVDLRTRQHAELPCERVLAALGGLTGIAVPGVLCAAGAAKEPNSTFVVSAADAHVEVVAEKLLETTALLPSAAAPADLSRAAVVDRFFQLSFAEKIAWVTHPVQLNAPALVRLCGDVFLCPDRRGKCWFAVRIVVE